ncbi:hypothetical protein [Photobacterium ganghwense]|uniref:hypothetical protein n=1 Tax=Photobacterium ganghwense TaxID=320778 RepID=UPI001A8DF6D2|nr:hypothetical protein [Photobacterium ganghwense]QSV17556.1 hypothetical protein FH974_25980 [Photobacterium ganghwense]
MQASEGYITFTMTDEQYNLHIALGGARFTTQQHVNDAWKSIPHFPGQTVFFADLVDKEGVVIENKPVSAEIIAKKLAMPIQALIQQARKQQRENASLRGNYDA